MVAILVPMLRVGMHTINSRSHALRGNAYGLRKLHKINNEQRDKNPNFPGDESHSPRYTTHVFNSKGL